MTCAPLLGERYILRRLMNDFLLASILKIETGNFHLNNRSGYIQDISSDEGYDLLFGMVCE